eukprot:179639_1
MPELVNLKVSELRKHGYNDVSEWLSDPKHLYIGRKMRIFIHTKYKTNEAPGTKVTRNDNGDKILKRPIEIKNKPFDTKLLSYPVGSYVNKKGKIIHLYIIPKSKWHNPFKVKTTNKRGQIIDEFDEYLTKNISLSNNLNELNNYTEIGCWCKPKKCHGDTILKHFNKGKTNNKYNEMESKIEEVKCEANGSKVSKKRKRNKNKNSILKYFQTTKSNTNNKLNANGNINDIDSDESIEIEKNKKKIKYKILSPPKKRRKISKE